MDMRSLTLPLSLLVAACSTQPTPDPRHEEYAAIEERLASSNDSARSYAHVELVGMCCPRQFVSSIRPYPFACRRIESIVTTTNDVRSLEGLLTTWPRGCIESVSVDHLLSAVERPVFATHEHLREKLYDVIALHQPTERTAAVIFAEHARPAETRSERGFWGAARILPKLAEPDLARLQHAMLVHPSARARQLAATALLGAVDFPLELPGLARDLELASRDADPHVAATARIALLDLQRTEQAGLAAAIAASFSSEWGIAELGRRRLTCGIADIDTRLSLIANVPDWVDGNPPRKPVARRTLAERQRYCATPRTGT